jgi:hypothetical protein
MPPFKFDVFKSNAKSFISKLREYVLFILNGIGGTCIVHLLWVLIHWSAARLYPYFCAKSGVFGLILSSVLSQAPHCIAIAWLVETSRSCLKSMWLGFGTFAAYKLTQTLATRKDLQVSQPGSYRETPSKYATPQKRWKPRSQKLESDSEDIFETKSTRSEESSRESIRFGELFRRCRNFAPIPPTLPNSAVSASSQETPCKKPPTVSAPSRASSKRQSSSGSSKSSRNKK